MFWTSTAEYESRLRNAEAKLLEYARRNDKTNCLEVTAFDTDIPRSAIPCLAKNSPCLNPAKEEDDEKLTIHCIRAVSKELPPNHDKASIPLVNLHGYMNAGAYFYRNMGGLSKFFSTVYAVDMLGWGLSSRVPHNEVQDRGSVESAEEFFVESIEAWRSANNIDKIVLSGHSFGGYVAVAYAERYPERVERLILLSPIGVPEPPDPDSDRDDDMPLKAKVFFGVFRTMFEVTTPGGVLRSLTEFRGSNLVKSYVDRRLPEVSDAEEKETLADFLYFNSVLPPSGECFLRSLFTSSIFAKKPLLFRIPSLQVKNVHFMYGTHDWMDVSGGMNAEILSHWLSEDLINSSLSVPNVNVYLVPNAGHLLTIENPRIVNAGMIRLAGGKVNVRDREMPKLMDRGWIPHDEEWLRRARESMEGWGKRIAAEQ